MEVFCVATISLRVTDTDYHLIQNYISINGINLSAFIREAIMDKIEEDFSLDEERILAAKERSKTERIYDHTEVWEELGV